MSSQGGRNGQYAPVCHPQDLYAHQYLLAISKGVIVVDMEALYRPETAVFGSRTTTQPVLPLTLKSPAEERWGEVDRHRKGGFFFFFFLL